MPSLQEIMKMAFAQPQGGGIPQPAGQPLGPQALGNGMAAQAAQVLQSRPYQMHVKEAQAMGEAPMSPQEFMQRMQQAQQQPPAAPGAPVQ